MPRNPPVEEGRRFFTVEEANAQVAALELEFSRIAAAREELIRLVEALGGAETASQVLDDDALSPPGKEREAGRLRGLAGEIAGCVERVNGLGCLVKDVETGLVDFYAIQDGEPVLLCWQFGEPAVSHFHGVEEGFAGRQPIPGVTVRPPALLN
jgi:hypothetical protein